MSGCFGGRVAVALWLTSLTLSGVQASSPDCQDLVRPLLPDHPDLIFGKWIYVLGSGDPEPYHQALGSLRSSWIHLSATNHSQTVTLRWGDHCFNRCIYGEANATVSGVATMFHRGRDILSPGGQDILSPAPHGRPQETGEKNLSDHKGHILQSCDNCLLWTDTFRNGDVTGRYIMQFTRTGTMEPQDLEVFKKQVVCLNFPQNYHSSDGVTELCPDNQETN